MVSDLTSLITKIICRPLLWGLFFFIACSSPSKKSSDEASIELSEELNSISKKVETIQFGPTLKEGGSFLDKTKEYGLENLSAVAFNVIDFNFDGANDLVLLPTYYSRPLFFEFNKEKKKFSPWKHDPLPLDFKASFILIYDLNNDRVPDLLSAVLNQRTEMTQVPVKYFKGEIRKGLLHFIEDPKALVLPVEPTSSMSLIDYDLDGLLDLFIGNWFQMKSGQYTPTADRLFKNQRGHFQEMSSLLTNESNKTADQIYPPLARPTYGSSTCDIDQNGYPDILTVSSSGYKNKLWMNLKDIVSAERYFDDAALVSSYAADPEGSLIETGGGRSFFSACTDYNDDGLMDIFLGELSHAYDNESVDRSSILTGSKETYPPYFIRTEYVSDASSESWNQGDRRAVWVDYNLDGRVDLLVDNSGFPPYSRLVLFEQDESHAFMNVASQAGIDVVNPVGTISLDLNKDGYPDIITSQNNIRRADIPPRLYVLENQLKYPKRRAVRVYLSGMKANTQGIGAMVMLYTQKGKQKVVQRRWNELTQGGLSSQNEDGVHFGVGEDFEIVGIKVRWPLAKKSGIQAGQAVEKLYSLVGFEKKSYMEVTACEDGRLFMGKASCHL
ncbi:MAG: CRTAC1 family protein [Bacteriovoracaceae bacterium]